jgi:hypothetical protein
MRELLGRQTRHRNGLIRGLGSGSNSVAATMSIGFEKLLPTIGANQRQT